MWPTGLTSAERAGRIPFERMGVEKDWAKGPAWCCSPPTKALVRVISRGRQGGVLETHASGAGAMAPGRGEGGVRPHEAARSQAALRSGDLDRVATGVRGWMRSGQAGGRWGDGRKFRNLLIQASDLATPLATSSLSPAPVTDGSGPGVRTAGRWLWGSPSWFDGRGPGQ